MNKLTLKPTKEWRWPKESYALMAIFRDVTSHSRQGFTIFTQPPYSSWTSLVFLPTGKDALKSGSKPDPLGLRFPSCIFKRRGPSSPIAFLPAFRLFLSRRVQSVRTPPPRHQPLWYLGFPSIDTAMASDDSSSSGVNAETRIGSLEAAMGQLRIKMDANDKKIDAVSKAGEKSWDLLNTELRQLRADLTGNLSDFKEETRTSFKDEANTQGDFGNRISALELEVAKLKSKLET